LEQTVKTHEAGFISALCWVDGRLYCGGKDGKLVVVLTNSLSVLKTYDLGTSIIRAIDVVGNLAIIGLGNGNLIELTLDPEDKRVLIESHCEGETWGLALDNGDNMLTSGDDN
jgi:hypothetical protein